MIVNILIYINEHFVMRILSIARTKYYEGGNV